MTTVEIELTDETAQAARQAGLLAPLALEPLLREALARRARAAAADKLGAVMERMGATASARGLTDNILEGELATFKAERSH